MRAAEEPNFPGFMASLSSAYRDGEVRPTHAPETQSRHVRHIETIVPRVTTAPTPPPTPAAAPPLAMSKVVPLKAATPMPADRPMVRGMDPELVQRLEEQRRESGSAGACIFSVSTPSH